MHEVYTCICGGQRWTILGVKIECDKCGKEYGLMWLDDEMESPEDFNKRINKEAQDSRIKPERMDYIEKGLSFRKLKNKEA